MPITFGSRIKNAWNAFNNKDPTQTHVDYGVGYSRKPDRVHLSLGNERSIIAALYNRIAIDVASVSIRHVRVDQNGKYTNEIDSYLDDCLTLSANLDQTARAFIQDAVLTMFDDGCVALVPVETSENPDKTGSYDIYQLRVGRIREWYPQHVKLDVYDQRDGRHHEVVMSKESVAIIENPLYTVMNEPNSTLRRLIRKINLLDGVDEQTSSGKLDIIIQLPYTVRSEARMKQAEQRRKAIEEQLAGSKYGIAYVDATEHITQLNRAAENNLLSQIEYLTKVVFNQLGVIEAVFYGEANEQEMLNYYNRTLEPIVSAFCDSMTRSFMTKTARTQGQRIMFFRDPFKLVPVNQIADVADKFTRNEVLSSNEVRSIVGYKPVDDVRANELRNKNLNTSEANPAGSGPIAGDKLEEEDLVDIKFEKETEHSALEHHGIKNQRWGVRNGPPYPLNTEAKIKLSKTPYELSKAMSDISYQDFSTLKSPDKTIEDKQGSCYDQTLIELRELKRMGLKPKAGFFIWQDPKTKLGGPCHSFVYYEQNGKINWFENSWGQERGIHSYDSIEEMQNDIKRRSKKNNSQSKELTSYTNIVFSDFGTHEPGEDYIEVADKALATINKKMRYG